MVLASSPPMVATTPRCSPVDSVRTGDREVDTLRTLKSAENGCGTLEVRRLLKKAQLAILRTDPESSCMYHVEKSPRVEKIRASDPAAWRARLLEI